MPRSCSKWILGASLLAGALALACATERGLEPKPSGFNIYIGGTYWTDAYDETSVVHKLYILDADSLLLRDSIPLRTRATDICASPDGRWLYVQESTWGYGTGPFLSKIDMRTKAVVWTLEGTAGTMTLVENGDLLVVDGLYHGDVLSTSDGRVVHSFGDSLRLWHGPVTGSKIAAVVAGDSNLVRVLDVKNGELDGGYMPRLRSGRPISAQYAVLHRDERRVLVIGVSGPYESWFVVGDVQTGETLLEHGMVYPYGEIAISSDGARAVVTDPGRALFGDSRPTMDVFDLHTLKHLKRFEGPPPLFVIPAQVRFLPGDRRIVTAPDMPSFAEGPLAFFDVSSMCFEDTVWIYPRDYPKDAAHVMDGLGVGPRP